MIMLDTRVYDRDETDVYYQTSDMCGFCSASLPFLALT